MALNYPIRNSNSDKSVDHFNEFIEGLVININNTDINQITFGNGEPLYKEVIDDMSMLLEPLLTKITIYYPISKNPCFAWMSK